MRTKWWTLLPLEVTAFLCVTISIDARVPTGFLTGPTPLSFLTIQIFQSYKLI